MAKNLVIEQIRKMKELDRQIQQVPPGVYASVAIAMHQAGMDNELIADLFAASQALWAKHNEEGTIRDMMDLCEQLTGIEMRPKEE